MRTFLVALGCSIAAFIAGFALLFFHITNNTDYPLLSPGLIFYQWQSASGMVVETPKGKLRSDESMRWLASARFFGSTQALLFVFKNLTAAQVTEVKQSLPFLLETASAHDKAQAEVVAGCIAKADVGDDLRDCGVAVIKMGIKSQ